MAVQLTIRAHEIATLLDRAPAGVEVLSLDCFDTLIWRATHSPADVFAALDVPGGAMGPRQWSESAARRTVFNRSGAGEIGLRDVYHHLLPRADDAAIDAAVATELAEEARHAVAFAPIVALMREARARGLRVILVSDMYLTEVQLRAHVAAAAGEDVLALVERVFVSHEHGRGKTDGLFEQVLSVMGVAPDAILHVGDNRAADHDAAFAHGLNAVHLQQFDDATETRLRHEANAAMLIDPAVRVTRPVFQPHRPQLALRTSDDPAHVLGHDVLGPAMHAFAQWVRAEMDEMAARLGRPVRPLFVMRDGFLPAEVFDTLYPDAGAGRVELSRFVATRASLDTAQALDEYLAEWLHRLPLAVLTRQLMLFEHEVARALKLRDTEEGRAAFARALRQPDLGRKLVKRAHAFGDKLLAHLRTAGVGEGDAVMLVDIGYNGTVQNLLAPMLERRMGLTVAGRYLFLREGQLSGLDKRGMLDARSYETRTLHALAASVVVLEQLCNVPLGSTVDFTPDGAPMREAVDAKGHQRAVRETVQAGAIAYARAVGAGVLRAAASDDLAARTRAGAAALARLFFMPSADEVTLFDGFNYDPNMGSAMATRLFDADAAEAAMRRRGLAYLDEGACMYRPGELQRHGLPAMLSMFASARLGLDWRGSDFAGSGGVEVPVVLLGASDGGVVDHLAWPTAQGWFRLVVPVGRFVPGVQIGHLCEWVEVDEAAFISTDDLEQGRFDRARAVQPITDGLEAMAPGLYRAAPTGLLVAPPPASDAAQVLTLVFRPIRWREPAVAAPDSGAVLAA
jgi:FMN phosphatase YigB (HAD superfamily)